MISANLSPGLMMFDVSLKILRALWRDVERCGEELEVDQPCTYLTGSVLCMVGSETTPIYQHSLRIFLSNLPGKMHHPVAQFAWGTFVWFCI